MTIRYGSTVIAALVALLAAGCSPVYTTNDVYHPPGHTEGLACIKECGNDERLCQRDCAEERRMCEYDARDRAKERYNEAVDQYSLDTERYGIELREHHDRVRDHEREMGRLQHEREVMERRCNQGDEQACSRASYMRKEIDRSHGPREPSEPQRPQLADFERTALNDCDFTCGCREAFNTCYVTCGGQVTQERQCVDNCD